MTDIQQAKRSLGRELRACEGFVGVGIGGDGIRLYAESETAPVVKMLRDRWGATYEGFAISVVLSEGFRAQQRRSGAPAGQIDPPPEVVRYANALVWKDPCFDVLHQKNEGQYPFWVGPLVKNLRTLHERHELLLPDLRAFGNRTVALFSDYGGEHKGSRYYTYSFLVTGLDLAVSFQDKMADIRQQYGLNETEIAYKRFRDGRICAALPDYLKALNNLLPGLLITVVVDKEIKSLFGIETKDDRYAVREQLKAAGFRSRKPAVIEKALRVTHMAAFLAGLLAHDGQKIFWMTDNDAISEGERGASETLSLFARALELYTRKGVSFELVGGGTTFAKRHTDTLDLLSAADIVCGALSDYLTKRENVPEPDIKVKEGSDRVLQWMPLSGVGLSKLVLVMRPDHGGIRIGSLRMRTDVRQERVEVPIHL